MKKKSQTHTHTRTGFLSLSHLKMQQDRRNTDPAWPGHSSTNDDAKTQAIYIHAILFAYLFLYDFIAHGLVFIVCARFSCSFSIRAYRNESIALFLNTSFLIKFNVVFFCCFWLLLLLVLAFGIDCFHFIFYFLPSRPEFVVFRMANNKSQTTYSKSHSSFVFIQNAVIAVMSRLIFLHFALQIKYTTHEYIYLCV